MNLDGINIYAKAHKSNQSSESDLDWTRRSKGSRHWPHFHARAGRSPHWLRNRSSSTRAGCIRQTALSYGPAVFSVISIRIWSDMVFDREDLIPYNIRPAAANKLQLTWLEGHRSLHEPSSRRKKSLTHSKRTMCECFVEHAGNTSDNKA